MLKELNSIFAGLLDLQGYPLRPPAARSRAPADIRPQRRAARAPVASSPAGAGRLARSPAWLGARR
jgi:hypothetical protein